MLVDGDGAVEHDEGVLVRGLHRHDGATRPQRQLDADGLGVAPCGRDRAGDGTDDHGGGGVAELDAG